MGWYKRWSEELIRSDVWQDPDLRHFFSDLMDLAGCDPGDGKIRELLTQQPLPPTAIQSIIKISPEKYAEFFGILLDKGMIKVDAEGFVTLCNWEHYQNHYRRQAPYRKKQDKVTSKVTNKVTDEKDEEYILHLLSLYKMTREELDVEFIKMKGWLLDRPKRKMTRRFVISWLNRNITERVVRPPVHKPDVISSHPCVVCGKPARVKVEGRYMCSSTCDLTLSGVVDET